MIKLVMDWKGRKTGKPGFPSNTGSRAKARGNAASAEMREGSSALSASRYAADASAKSGKASDSGNIEMVIWLQKTHSQTP
jgi:hypothetical protein